MISLLFERCEHTGRGVVMDPSKAARIRFSGNKAHEIEPGFGLSVDDFIGYVLYCGSGEFSGFYFIMSNRRIFKLNGYGPTVVDKIAEEGQTIKDFPTFKLALSYVSL